MICKVRVGANSIQIIDTCLEANAEAHFSRKQKYLVLEVCTFYSEGQSSYKMNYLN